MWPLFVLASFVSVMVAASGVAENMQRETPASQRVAAAVVAKYRSFAYSAAAYMAANPTASGAIYWSTISASPVVPAAVKQTNIGSTWKIVANGSGSYVICAEMPEAAIAAIAQLMPAARRPLAATDGKVVFAESSTEANTESVKCD